MNSSKTQKKFDCYRSRKYGYCTNSRNEIVSTTSNSMVIFEILIDDVSVKKSAQIYGMT